jgi:hypothetical protein
MVKGSRIETGSRGWWQGPRRTEADPVDADRGLEPNPVGGPQVPRLIEERAAPQDTLNTVGNHLLGISVLYRLTRTPGGIGRCLIVSPFSGVSLHVK